MLGFITDKKGQKIDKNRITPTEKLTLTLKDTKIANYKLKVSTIKIRNCSGINMTKNH